MELTSKQRAQLRGIAAGEDTIIGKDKNVKEKIKANKSPVHYQKDGKDFVFADARQIRHERIGETVRHSVRYPNSL